MFQNVNHWAAREKTSWQRFGTQNGLDPSEGLPDLRETEETFIHWNVLTSTKRHRKCTVTS
jgi:hypothetical protein